MKHFYNLNFSIKSFKILKFLILFFTTSLVYGQTTTFSGVGFWSDPINWDNGVPDAAIDVIIADGATCSIDIDAECKSLTFAVNSIAESMVSILATNTLNVYEAITYSLPSANFRQTFEVNDGTLQCASIYMPNVDNNNKRLALLINSGYVHVTGDFDMRANNNGNWIEFTDAGGLRVDGTLGFGNWGRIRAYNSTIVIGGDFNVATFEAGTSTVVFESAAPQRVDNVSYYNI